MYIYTYTYIFLKKIYKNTYLYIRDGRGLGRPRPVSRPVPKHFGTEISRPKMHWDGTRRDGTGKFEHP